jgi:hypothetical protein
MIFNTVLSQMSISGNKIPVNLIIRSPIPEGSGLHYLEHHILFHAGLEQPFGIASQFRQMFTEFSSSG